MCNKKRLSPTYGKSVPCISINFHLLINSLSQIFYYNIDLSEMLTWASKLWGPFSIMFVFKGNGKFGQFLGTLKHLISYLLTQLFVILSKIKVRKTCLSRKNVFTYFSCLILWYVVHQQIYTSIKFIVKAQCYAIQLTLIWHY